MNKLDFDTSHHQFYIVDKGAEDFETKPFWTDSADKSRLAVVDGTIGVLTGSYGHIKADLIISDTKNDISFDSYDHVVEGSLKIKSGVLQILDCPVSEVIFETALRPGLYRIRVYSSNLASTYGEEEDMQDFYSIEIWPDTSTGRKVLKQYQGY